MTVIVAGAKGMLGRHVLGACIQADIEAVALTRDICDFTDPVAVYQTLSRLPKNAVVINCAGRREGSSIDLVLGNTLIPHVLADAAKRTGMHLIHISTDCVFSGYDRALSPRKRDVHDTRNPNTTYGWSKACGEMIDRENTTIVRTSFVGPDHGLMRWLTDLSQGAMIEAWTQAWWSGSTVEDVASALVLLSQRTDVLAHYEHVVVANPITKASAVRLIAAYLGRDDIQIVDSVGMRIDRSLKATIQLRSFADALSALNETAVHA